MAAAVEKIFDDAVTDRKPGINLEMGRHSGKQTRRRRKVTGRAKFGADTYLPNMLHGKVLRSPHAHARIKSIDMSKALALPA
ncbi:MAG: hypothetical protein CM1200mP18_09920 [Gammaproteobacteria bacterium]|nr:MAG: hypothetical protein CM1200mP18_09920 [Gammaproteobacteria bacterium]